MPVSYTHLWAEIKYMCKKRLKSNLMLFFTTMLATIVFDLTIAIVIGLLLACILFIVEHAGLKITIEDVDLKRLDRELHASHLNTKIVYLSGPMFFGTQGQLKAKLKAELTEAKALIFSMRGVPSIDDSGLMELKEIADACHRENVKIVLCGVSQAVLERIERYEMLETFDNIMWDAMKALVYIDELYRKE